MAGGLFRFFSALISGGVRIQSITSYPICVNINTAFENKSRLLPNKKRKDKKKTVGHEATAVPDGYAVTLTFLRNIFWTSAVSSTNSVTIRIFSSGLLVLVIYQIGNFFLNGRAPTIFL